MYSNVYLRVFPCNMGRPKVHVTVLLQGVKLRLIQAPMRLNFSFWRPNPEN